MLANEIRRSTTASLDGAIWESPERDHLPRGVGGLQAAALVQFETTLAMAASGVARPDPRRRRRRSTALREAAPRLARFAPIG